MKLIPVTYYGFTAMDRRFSSPMLPWIVSEIRKRDFSEKLSVGIEDGILQAYNPDFELQFSHKIWQVTRFSQADQDPTTFLYLMRDDHDTLLYCYLFQAKKSADVLHVVDRVLDPMLNTPFSNPSAHDFLQNYANWKLGSRAVSRFFERVEYHSKEKMYGRSGGHTFFVPIDDKKHNHRLQDVDGYIIDGHVVPNVVLFTRPTQKGFVYETAANGDYIYIVVAMLRIDGRDFIKSYTILGDGEHRKGEVLSEIVKANIPVTNGVVHLISQPLAVLDRQLRPFPYLSVAYKVEADPDLNVTCHVAWKGRIGKILRRAKGMYTFFAPRDRAWTDYLGYSEDERNEILSRHLIVSDVRHPMSKLATESSDTVLDTLGGSLKLQIRRTNGSFYLVWGQKWVKVVRPDYECSDGVVHIVDDIFATPKRATAAPPPTQTSFWAKMKSMSRDMFFKN